MRPSTGIQESLSPNSQNKVTSGRKDHKDEKFLTCISTANPKITRSEHARLKGISKTLT